MKTTDLKTYLEKIGSCEGAVLFSEGKTAEQAYNDCQRGDWLLWLFARTNPEDKRILTLAKGLCANTVRHLMTDERSIKAVDAAILYGKGEIGEKQLSAAAAAAYAAAAADAAYADVYAADAAYYAYSAAADTAVYADVYAADAYAAAAADADEAAAAYAARKDNQLLTASIVRGTIPFELFNLPENI